MKKGFTLLEVIISVGILAVLSGLLWFSVGISPYRDLRRAATIIAYDIRYMQQLAVQEGIRTRITFSVRDNMYTKKRSYEARPGQLGWRSVTDNNVTLIKNANLTNIVIGNHLSHIEFTERGTPVGAGSIRLANNGYSILITITLGGGRVLIH